MYINNLSFDPRDPRLDVPGLSGVHWGVQIFTTRNMYGLDPSRIHLEMHSRARMVCDRLQWAGGQRQVAGCAEAEVYQDDGAIVWRVRAEHDEPIKVIKLLLWGLPEVALAQGWWHATSPHDQAVHSTPAQPLRWRYPWPEWLTPWACAGDSGGAVCLSIRDEQVRAKRFYVHHPPYNDGQPVVELICEADARHWGTTFAAPEMRLRLCARASEIDADFAAHLAFVERAYQVPRWEERADVPGWFHKVRLILNLHGQHWTGYVFNTFDRMAEVLRFVAQHIPGEQVLAYLPGWEGRYYFAYPWYQPGEDLGGPEGFRRLLATARELGVHVMPMFGMHGANVQHYPDWERAIFRNRTGRIARLVNCPDWDSDRACEDDQQFLNPGEPGFRRHLIDQISAVVREYSLDGVFLDTSACWFNDPRHNLYDGYRALLEELHARHPGLLIAGEGWYDALLALFPVNQSWLGVDRRYRQPALLTRYARALGHLSSGTPGHGSTGVHEGGFYPATPDPPTLGHISALGIVDDTLDRYTDQVVQICRAAAQR